MTKHSACSQPATTAQSPPISLSCIQEWGQSRQAQLVQNMLTANCQGLCALSMHAQLAVTCICVCCCADLWCHWSRGAHSPQRVQEQVLAQGEIWTAACSVLKDGPGQQGGPPVKPLCSHAALLLNHDVLSALGVQGSYQRAKASAMWQVRLDVIVTDLPSSAAACSTAAALLCAVCKYCRL